jgi:ABC-type antimicrobial peptide transport system permease subunit
VEPLDATYALRHAETRMATSIVTAFAGIAFLIAIAGVFGVMTVVVNSRTREIGIRMALGAGAQEVRRMVFGSSLRLILAGVAIGLATAVGASRYIESQLFGVTPTDPLTLGVVSAVVTMAAMLATWHPATRAARVDPAETLRVE